MTYGNRLFWATLLSLITFSQLQVAVDPPGPLYIPISTQRNITCSVEGGTLSQFVVTFSNKDFITYTPLPGAELVTGIVVIFADFIRFLMSININDTSVTGIRCEGNLQTGSSSTPDVDTLDLTIYGVPDPPAITSLSLEGKSLRSSWDYVRIPTVNVTLYWSLSFFRPSQLSNTTTTLLNTNTYNYTLQGVRSCDPFRLCIRAENVVGSSSWSCIINILPYLPQREDIQYSLVQVNQAFSLNVTVMVPQECQSSMNTYCVSVITAEGSKVLSHCVRSDDGYINVLVENLVWNTFYNFSIISNNSLEQQSTAAISFYTNNVEGVDICSLADEEVYEVSCRYVSGAVRTGCSYQLTGTNSAIISIELMREEYALHKASDINCCYNNIIIRNSVGYVVMSGSFSALSIVPCQATTIATDSTAHSRNVSGLTIIIIMGAVIGVQIMLCLMTPFITIFIYKKFFINQYKQKQSNKGSPTSQEDCSENPAYGVMPLSSSSSSQNREKTNVLPEYEVIDLQTKK